MGIKCPETSRGRWGPAGPNAAVKIDDVTSWGVACPQRIHGKKRYIYYIYLHEWLIFMGSISR